MGPVETKLRARLNYGLGLTAIEAHTLGGRLGRNILARLVREGIAIQRAEGRYTLATYHPDASALAEAETNRLLRLQALRRVEEERQARAVERASELEELRRREAERARHEQEQRRVMAGIGAYSQAERKLVLAERIAALRESRAGRA